MKLSSKKAPQPRRSLVQYVRDARKVNCPVCKLSPEIREQLRAAKDTRISVATQLDWLKHEHGITLTVEQINSHRGGRHEGPSV